MRLGGGTTRRSTGGDPDGGSSGDPRAWYAASVAATTSLTGAMDGYNFEVLDELDSLTVVTRTAAFLDEKTVEVTAARPRRELGRCTSTERGIHG